MGYNEEFEGGNYDVASFQFPIPFGYCGIDKSSSDYQISKNIIQLLVSFAENGKPTKTWGNTKEFKRYYTNDELPFSYAIERDGQTQHHLI
ncbi:unnamed protein product, partial [Allacma fusca]